MASKSLDEKRKLVARDFIAKLVKERFGDNQTRAAPHLGVTQGYLSEILADPPKKGAGVDLLEKAADITDVLIDRILGRELADLDVALDYNAREVEGRGRRPRVSEPIIEAAKAEVRAGKRRTPAEWWAHLTAAQVQDLTTPPDGDGGGARELGGRIESTMGEAPGGTAKTKRGKGARR